MFLFGKGLVSLANSARGFWPGHRGYFSDGLVSRRYLLAKTGSDDRHAAVCGAGDVPIGVFTDEAEQAGELIDVVLLATASETLLGHAAESIATGSFLVPAASGGLRALPASPGSYYIVGRALQSAEADGRVVFVPSFPTLRVVGSQGSTLSSLSGQSLSDLSGTPISEL